MYLYKYMPYFSSELEISNNSNKVIIILLSYVLPFNSLNLLPEK